MSRRGKSRETEIWLPGHGGLWGVIANGHGVSFWGYVNVLELDSGDGCTT